MKDFNLLESVDIDGPSGKFSIAFAGTKPDGPCFLYKDKNHNYFFYAEIESKPARKISVVSASTGKWSGGPVKLNLSEQNKIEKNNEHFFKSRRSYFPDHIAAPDEAAELVIFSWGFQR